MRIVAIDAGRGHCNVSRSVEVAARSAELAGASVTRVKLKDLHIKTCTGCKLCLTGDGCKIHDDLSYLSELIAKSDGVIFGIPESRNRRGAQCNSMIDRLATYFSSNGQMKLPGFGDDHIAQEPTARATKRAIIITANHYSLPIGAFFSRSRGTISELRSIFSGTKISPIGALEVTDKLKDGRLTDDVRDKAYSLGRILAGKC